jgi:hypothetical protein
MLAAYVSPWKAQDVYETRPLFLVETLDSGATLHGVPKGSDRVDRQR